MRYYPDLQTFRQLAAGGRLVPVRRQLSSDALTPVQAFQRLDDGGPAYLFESVVGGDRVGRWSFVGAGPIRQLAARGREVVWRDAAGVRAAAAADPLDELRRELRAWNTAGVDDATLFQGGAVGYAAYDAARYTEHLPHAPPDDRGLPDLSFAFYDRGVSFDHARGVVVPLALARLDLLPDVDAAYADARRRVDELVDKLRAPRRLPPLEIDARAEAAVPFRSNFTRPAFEAAVRQCQEYIRAGDIFQVVLSQRLEVDYTGDPFRLYRVLRMVNPSPFMFFLRTAEATLVGSSPEIMARLRDGRVVVRPLAGTRPRGKTEAEDFALEEELLRDEKERAEHVMLVDLGRNDVGRVCRPGSVELHDVMVVERYSHVMHITSHVSGELAPGKDAFDVFRACLPAGTVSGAPKVRAMEIIDELEPHRRGPYAGAVGYFDYNGNLDTCITLRTVVAHNGKAYIQAGAGIVADSVPASEYQETLNKAQGLLQALALAESTADQDAPGDPVSSGDAPNAPAPDLG